VKISGTGTLHAPLRQVWTALTDPAVLARAIPGWEQMEALGPDSYRLTITARVASTQGTYTGEVSLTDRQEPTSLQLAINLAGAPGTLSATVQVLLEPAANGSTEASYDATATPGGPIAGVGQRLLASTATKLANEFLASVDELLVSGAAAPSPDSVAEARPSAAPPQGVRVGGAAGVASLADAATRRASGMTGELPTADRQPAGRPRARPPTESFLQGVLVGAGIVLAGTIAARLLGRRSR
jgi:uncharacterized protein